MFEEFAKLPDLKQVTFPMTKKRKEKAGKEKIDGSLSKPWPSKCFYKLCHFSINILSFTFVLIGSIILWCY